MLRKTFAVGMLGCNCSILADEESKQAVVVDPGDDPDRILMELAKDDLKVVAIVHTHAHIDHIGGTGRLLSIEGSPKLATLDLPMLDLVGNNLLLDGTDLVNLDGFSALEIVGNDLSLVANADLATLDLPALQSVGASLSVDDNDALTDIVLTALMLVGDDLHVEGNALLSTFDLSALTDIGGNLIVSTNAALPTCAAEALRDTIGLANIGGAVSISGNDSAGTCP